MLDEIDADSGRQPKTRTDRLLNPTPPPQVVLFTCDTQPCAHRARRDNRGGKLQRQKRRPGRGKPSTPTRDILASGMCTRKVSRPLHWRCGPPNTQTESKGRRASPAKEVTAKKCVGQLPMVGPVSRAKHVRSHGKPEQAMTPHFARGAYGHVGQLCEGLLHSLHGREAGRSFSVQAGYWSGGFRMRQHCRLPGHLSLLCGAQAVHWGCLGGGCRQNRLESLPKSWEIELSSLH